MIWVIGDVDGKHIALRFISGSIYLLKYLSAVFPLTIIFIFVISVVFSLITWLVFKTTFKNEVDILIREE